MNNQELLLDNRISNIENMLAKINRNLESNKSVRLNETEKAHQENVKFWSDIPNRLALIWAGEEMFYNKIFHDILGFDSVSKGSVNLIVVKSIAVMASMAYGKNIAESVIVPVRDLIADGINYTKDTIIDTYNDIYDYISPTGEIHHINHINSEIYSF